MAERDISLADVRAVLDHGSEIESYPADQPYPSYLRLGWIGDRALHVVAADNVEEEETIVITVYEPDPKRWEPGFAQRRK